MTSRLPRSEGGVEQVNLLKVAGGVAGAPTAHGVEVAVAGRRAQERPAHYEPGGGASTADGVSYVGGGRAGDVARCTTHVGVPVDDGGDGRLPGSLGDGAVLRHAGAPDHQLVGGAVDARLRRREAGARSRECTVKRGRLLHVVELGGDDGRVPGRA